MKKILISILLLTANTLIYSQSMDLNHKKIHIVDSTMGLGITPTSRLHVFGNGTSSNMFNLTNDKDATKDSSVIVTSNGSFCSGTNTPYDGLVKNTFMIRDFNQGVNTIWIDSTTADSNKLHLNRIMAMNTTNGVYGDFGIGGATYGTNADLRNSFYISSYSGSLHLANEYYVKATIATNGVGIGMISPNAALDVRDRWGASYVFKAGNDLDAILDSSIVSTIDGKVGIGTATPTSKLEVVDGPHTYGGSVPLAIARTTTNDKIAFMGSAVTNFSEELPAYNIGLYGTAKGGTNNFAGYFNLGNVYVNENLGIGTKTPAAALHIKDGIERLGVVTYSTLDSTHLSTQDVRCTDTIKTSGTFYYDNAGSTLSINTAYGIVINNMSIIKDSATFYHSATTLSDEEVYKMPTYMSWDLQISVDSAGKKLTSFHVVCDDDGTVMLGLESPKRWSSITYLSSTNSDGYFCVYDAGTGMAIKNRLGYTVRVTIMGTAI